MSVHGAELHLVNASGGPVIVSNDTVRLIVPETTVLPLPDGVYGLHQTNAYLEVTLGADKRVIAAQGSWIEQDILSEGWLWWWGFATGSICCAIGMWFNSVKGIARNVIET